ncbi:hypothetical protein VNI00_008105 [Paramarasmius palmivorus]|uniref:Uncharacterized protein n=1 Tax=Paramarasmius palmivorus TaxID=297713 RepID=A0AAW0D0Y4_9AGAR
MADDSDPNSVSSAPMDPADGALSLGDRLLFCLEDLVDVHDDLHELRTLLEMDPDEADAHENAAASDFAQSLPAVKAKKNLRPDVDSGAKEAEEAVRFSDNMFPELPWEKAVIAKSNANRLKLLEARLGCLRATEELVRSMRRQIRSLRRPLVDSQLYLKRFNRQEKMNAYIHIRHENKKLSATIQKHLDRTRNVSDHETSDPPSPATFFLAPSVLNPGPEVVEHLRKYHS